MVIFCAFFLCVAVSFIAVLSVSRLSLLAVQARFPCFIQALCESTFFCIFYACLSSSCNKLLCGHVQCTAHLLSPFLGYFAVAAEVVVNVVHTSPCW